jgi:Domain of unknown function (DUF4328)/Septum formation
MAVREGAQEAPRTAAAYKPIAIRAQVLRWWLAAGVVVNATVTVLNAIHLTILDADGFSGNEAVVASDERLAVGGAALLATFLVSTVLWLTWFHRAYRNLPSLAPIGLRYGTGWAVGAWFVPILNLFRPKQIANDIWRGADPEPPESGGWTDRPVAPVVHWWWVSWLVAGVLGNVSARLLGDARTLGEERAAVLVDIAAGISFVVAGVLAMVVVRAVTEREAGRAAAVLGADRDADRLQTSRRARDRRMPAVAVFTLVGAAALVISVAVAAGTISDSDRDATGSVSEKTPVSVFELRSNDCINSLGDSGTVMRAVEVVPCAQRHKAEVVSTFNLPEGDFPGMNAVGSRAERGCSAALENATPPRRNGPTLFYLHPTGQSWSLGDREVTCIAEYEKPVRGSLRSGP